MGLREKDPVCGMEVNVDSSTLRSNYNGTDYYFCAPACKKQFEMNPEQFIDVAGKDNSGQEGEHSNHPHHHEDDHCCGGKGHNHSEHHEHCCHGHGHHN